MSAKCPKCKTPLEDADFGIKICANADCGAMLFVDFDGSVQLSTDVVDTETPPAAARTPEPPAKVTTTAPTAAGASALASRASQAESVPMMHVRSHYDSASSVKEETFPHSVEFPGGESGDGEAGALGGVLDSAANESFDSQTAAVSEEIANYDFGAELVTEDEAPAEPAPTPTWLEQQSSQEPTIALDAADPVAHIPPPPPDLVAASEAEAAEGPLNEEDWFDQPLDQSFATPEQMDVPAGGGSTVDFSDVVEFANSAELDHSPLSYHLWIEGIDSGEIRARVEDVLSDSRLNFHLGDVMKNLRRGVLEIRDLNPVKASFIASRLRAEAVNFRWRQSVFGVDEDQGGAA